MKTIRPTITTAASDPRRHADTSQKASLGRILVVEDHTRLRHSLERGLTTAGYDVVAAESGEAGFYWASTTPVDVVVLDVMLPGRSGLEILRELRRNGFSAPVIVLSARSTVADRVHGLEQGADDYLVKPFAFEELLARIRTQLHRGLPGRCISVKVADLEVNVATHRAVRGGIAIELSKQECRLLEYLMNHKNEVVTRADIERDVWRQPGGVATNVVDVCINALRKKVERPHLPKLIQTVRGAGYSLVESPGAPAASASGEQSRPTT